MLLIIMKPALTMISHIILRSFDFKNRLDILNIRYNEKTRSPCDIKHTILKFAMFFLCTNLILDLDTAK